MSVNNLFKVNLNIQPGLKMELHIGKSKKVTTSKLTYNGRVARTIETDDLLIKDVNDGDVLYVELNQSNQIIVSESGEICFHIGNMLFSEKTILDVIENGEMADIFFDDIKLGTVDKKTFGDLFTRVPRFNTVRRTSYKAIVKGVNEIAIVRYANTHQHTEYSRLDGMSKIKDIAKKTEWAGAITDHGVMTGVLKFDSELRALEKHPIIGMEPYIERINEDIFIDSFADLSVMDEEELKAYKKANFKKDHIIMFASNKEGYKNLIKLASLSWENFYGKNHIRYADLVNHSEGIIATTACLGSTIGRSLMEDEKRIRDMFFTELGKTVTKNKLAVDMSASEIDLLQGDDLDLTQEETDLLAKKLGVNITWLTSDMIKEIIEIQHKEEEFPLTLAAFDSYMKTAHLYLKKMIAIFGKDNFYIEIQRHKFATEEYYEKKCLELAEEYGLKIVSGIDSHYLNKEDKETHEVWLCEATKSNINDPKRLRFPGEGYYLMTSDEALELFEDLPEALDNSLEIAEKCNLDLKVKGYFLPKFPLPEGYDNEKEEEQVRYFLDLAREGYKKRFAGTAKYKDPVYLERMQFEEKTILNMGFASYFLIVQDFIAWAKDDKVAEHIETYFPKKYYDYDNLPEMAKSKDFQIYVGPGRGSAAGSLVAYCLGITNIDPIDYGLLFERFLNPDRISMPDIDTDFEDSKRELVIDYCKAKYGDDCISRIGTIGKLAAKGIIRSIQRCEAKEVALANKICKAIPDAPGTTLKSALQDSPELKEMYETDAEVTKVIDEAMTLEGLAKTVGQHACGILVAPDSVSNFLPQQLLKNKNTGNLEPTTQFTGGECEDSGLLKMDFLGLRTLGVLQEAISDVNSIEPDKNLTLDNVDIFDKRVYKFLSEGNTDCVFQFESPFMRKNAMEVLKDITTNRALTGRNCFDRMADATALGRPGPMAEIPNYVAAITDRSKVKKTGTPLDDITVPTNGIIVYQEQVMQAVKTLAGFTAGQADTVRKVMGKKLIDKLAELREWFINGSAEKGIPGCVKNGYSKEFAEEIWDRMAEFGKYAFNKSHSVAYTYLSAKTAWLSYYYPEIFMKANLNSFIDNNDKIKQYIGVCKERGIEVLPPDVNKSGQVFKVDFETKNASGKSAIRFGLKGIKSLGAKSALVIAERDANGEFTSFQDFVKRMIGIPKFDKSAIEALILAGALDSFEGSRKSKIDSLEGLEKLYKPEAVLRRNGQMTLLSLAEMHEDEELLEAISEANNVSIIDDSEYEMLYKLEREKEYTGFYISAHPVDEYKKYFEREGAINISELVANDDNSDEDFSDEESGSDNEVADVVTETENVDGNNANYVDEVVSVGGIIKDVEIRYTKKDSSKMKVFVIEDDTESIKCVLFPKKLSEDNNDNLATNGKIVMLTGKLVADESFGRQILVETIRDIDTLVSKASKYEVLNIPFTATGKASSNKIKEICANNPGNIKVIGKLTNGKEFLIGICDSSISTLDEIQRVVGEKNVIVK